MTALLAPGYWALVVIVLLWDVGLGGLMARNRKAPPPFTLLTALAAFLVAPALLVAVTAPSLLYGRSILAIAWVWPLTVLVYVAQSAYAVVRRLVTPAIGVPILVFNVVLALVEGTRYLLLLGQDVPAPLLALDNAAAGAVGFALGLSALSVPFAVLVPMLAPAYPARYRGSATLRATFAVLAAAFTIMVLGMELPRALRAQASFAPLAREQLQERPDGRFAVGLRLFPDLRDVPSPPVQRFDLPLVDSLGVTAVHLVLAPDAARPAPLDSLARLLETIRGDSTTVLVTLSYPANAASRYRSDPAAFVAQRALEVHEIVRRLRPEVILPVHEPYGAGERALGRLPVAAWERYVTATAAAAKRARPRTRVGLSAASYDARDSALFAWAARDGSPVDLPGFSLFPTFDGAVGLRARMAAADRWMRAAPASRRYWVFAAGGYPLRQGDASQLDAIWGTLAWATGHDRILGLVVADAGDYERLTGLRGAGGRVRPAAAAVRRAIVQLGESTQ